MRPNRIALLAVLALCWPAVDGMAQVRPIVELDLSTTRAKSTLPFHQPFLLKLTMPEAHLLRGVTCADSDGRSIACQTVAPNPLSKTTAMIEVPSLAHDRDFTFGITIGPAASFTTPAPTPVPLAFDGNTHATFLQHFDADVGFIRTQRAEYIGAATGVHIYAHPINKDAKVKSIDPLKQVSLMFGLAVAEIQTNAPVAKRFPAGNPLVGVGVRRLPGLSQLELLRDVRLTAGAMFFEQTAANPIVDRKRRKFDYFLGLSFDLEYKSALSPILSALGLG